jgi:homoserine O-acetyltransferase/O-succinyltransferase
MVERYYTSEHHGDYDEVGIGRLDLEEGGSIPDCRLAVATAGTLNAAKDNAVLVTTWYSGTHETWRTNYIGPEHALDPSRYFVVVVNQLGSGLSTSPHNAGGDIARSKFPAVRIGDDVVAQERLLRDHFGVDRLALVVGGGAMGAQQAYEWAVRFPDKVERVAAIAGTARTSQHNLQFVRSLIEAITSDPAWKGGEYSSYEEVAAGVRRHANLWGLMGLSVDFWRQELWLMLGFESLEAFRSGFLEGYFSLMDPNALLCHADKWQHADVARHTGGDLAAALGRITARTYVLPVDTDLLALVGDCAGEQALIPGSELRVLSDLGGQLSIFGDAPTWMPQIDGHLKELLAS